MMSSYDKKFDALMSATKKEQTNYGLRYKFPCGGFEYEQDTHSSYNLLTKEFDRETIYRSETEVVNIHLKKCKMCMVILGLSKREVGFSQRDVATLFELGISGKESSTGNYCSYQDIITHYGTLTAIRTENNVIIANSQDWSAGFAHVTYPRFDCILPLSTIRSEFNRQLETIKVIEDEGRVTLFTMMGAQDVPRFYLRGRDEGLEYVAELMGPCDTIEDALESMKPESVRTAIKNGIEVFRQGELFFIATDLKDDAVSGVGKPYLGSRWDSYNYLNFPTIEIKDGAESRSTNHRATRVGKWLGGTTVVKGTVRHAEHKMLTLGDKTKWYLVVRNLVKRAMSIRGRTGGRD